jgi:hypothetical protein
MTNKRKRDRRKKRKLSDLRQIAKAPAKASFFIEHAEDIAKRFPKTQFLMVVRESTKQQDSEAQKFRLLVGLKKFTNNILNLTDFLN